MKMTIICVGKIKESYFRDAIEEYSKRLSKYCTLRIVQVDDEKAPDELPDAIIELIKQKEADRILKHLKDGLVVSLAIEGKQFSSEGFANFFQDNMVKGTSHIVFIIGGSLGLSQAVLARSDVRLSFSNMTFPHQLMRVVLLEQIYRGFRILRGEPYHK